MNAMARDQDHTGSGARRTADHSRFASGKAQLAYALGEDGLIVHISEAARGAACRCRCPACGEPLVARKGSVAHHFAHRPDSSCNAATAAETALHRLAKEIVADKRRLRVPAVEVEGQGIRKRRAASKEIRFESAAVEHRLEGVVADVMVTLGDRRLLVEILVTHESDEEKVSRIGALGISAIEIDLSNVPRDASRREVEAAVLKTARRRWLFNPLLEETKREHEAAVAERERARALARDKAARALADSWLGLGRGVPAPVTPEQATIVREVCAVGLGCLLGGPVRGEEVFGVERTVWQAMVVRTAVIEPSSVFHQSFGIIPENLFQRLIRQGAMALPFAKFHSTALMCRARELEPSFTHPEATLRRYLRFLEEQGVLVERHASWCLPEEVSRQILARWTEVERGNDRREQLRSRTIRVLARAKVNPASFDLEAWCEREMVGWMGSVDEIAFVGGEPWLHLKDQLEALEAALGGGADPPDLLGLPIGDQVREASAARDTAAEQRRIEAVEREIRAGARRVSVLETLAGEVLGHEGDSWLNHAVASLAGATRRDLARESEKKAGWLLAELEREREGRLAAAERQRQADERARQTRIACERLQARAAEVHGETWGALFMKSRYPELGNLRPMDICVDQPTLERCARLIPQRRAGARLAR